MRTKAIKKRIICLLAMILTASCSATAFAASTTLDDENPVGSGDVYAIYKEDMPWNHIPVGDDGKAEAQLPDGTDIIIENADGSKRLMIDPITEKAALDWIKASLGSGYENVLAYHIYYADGKEIFPAEGVKVTIKAKRGAAFSMKDDGTLAEIVSNAADEMTFTTDGSPFYILCDKKQAAQDDVSSDSCDDISSDDVSDISSDTSSEASESSQADLMPADDSRAENDSQNPSDDSSAPNTGLGTGIACAFLLFGGALAVSTVKGSQEKYEKK